MDKEFSELLFSFIEIAKKQWIKGESKEHNSVGLTFENCLNKKADSMPFPDYKGIEIKCTQRFSTYPITLFSLALDGPNLYELNCLLEKYGVKDLEFKDKKILITQIKNSTRTKNGNYYFQLDIDKKEQKLYILIFDLEFNLLERKSYIEFQSIKDRLNLKLDKLALVYASKKAFNNDIYYRYYKIELYRLLSFNNFIKLLENDIIKVRIICRISRSGSEIGRQRNKGLVFEIGKDNLTKMFKLIKSYNYDLEYDNINFFPN